MPTLDEKQRAWLDAALKAKGRFTRAAGIKSDWEDYRRRRDKVVASSAGLPDDAPNKVLVQNGLKAADDLAATGKFSAAYKGLDAIKGLAKAATADRALTISVGSIDTGLNVLKALLNDVQSNTDFADSHYQALVDRANQIPTCGEQADLETALTYARNFAATEVILLGEITGRDDWVRRAQALIQTHALADKVAAIQRDITLHQSNGTPVKPQADRFADLKAQVEAKARLYTDPAVIAALGQAKKKAVQDRIRDIKRLDGFQKRDGDSTAPDQQTATARGGLKTTLNTDAIDIDGEGRQSRSELALAMAGIKDVYALADTKEQPVIRAREPKSFDPGTLFDAKITQLFGDKGLPDDVPLDKAAAIISEARTQMHHFVANADPASDEMFDLMLQTESQLAAMCSRNLTGVDNPKGASQSQALMFAELSKALRAELVAGCPNKMKDDASEITLNGVVYTLVAVIGEGGNGAARRYAAPDGTTVVVKSMKIKGGDQEEKDEQYTKMADEMRTHRQAMNGDPTCQTDDDNIVKMNGAALSDDGALHMVMEDAEGGDLGQVGNNLLMMTSLGVMPEEARKVLALDLVAQTVKGVKAMQERGLVHNDLKPQNMLLTKDGKVKIIDFGESRFVEDGTDEAPSAATGRFNTTPGYEAPETYKKDTVTSKADSFAVAGIASILMDQAMRETSAGAERKPVSAMGRLASGLMDKDPAKRPSLDAVLMSSLFDQAGSDYPAADVEDLKKASGEMNVALSSMTGTISAKDLIDNAPQGKGMTDTMWMPHYNRVARNGGEVPIAAFQTMPTKIDESIRRKQEEAAVAPPDEARDLRAQIKDLEQKKAFWVKEIKTQMDAARAEGAKDVEDTIADPANTMDVPGKGTMTLKAAMAHRDLMLQQIAQLQADFNELASDRPEDAAGVMAETNRTLTMLDGVVQAVDAGLKDALGPKGKFYLAEQKLSEVSARFGPRKVTGEEIAAKARPQSDPEEDDEGDLPPLPEGVIPDPPELPKKK